MELLGTPIKSLQARTGQGRDWARDGPEKVPNRENPKGKPTNRAGLHHIPLKINGWNLKITHLQRKIIFQTSIIVFHIEFSRVYHVVKKNKKKTWN